MAQPWSWHRGHNPARRAGVLAVAASLMATFLAGAVAAAPASAAERCGDIPYLGAGESAKVAGVNVTVTESTAKDFGPSGFADYYWHDARDYLAPRNYTIWQFDKPVPELFFSVLYNADTWRLPEIYTFTGLAADGSTAFTWSLRNRDDERAWNFSQPITTLIADYQPLNGWNGSIVALRIPSSPTACKELTPATVVAPSGRMTFGDEPPALAEATAFETDDPEKSVAFDSGDEPECAVTGADGVTPLVLSSETPVGKYAVECSWGKADGYALDTYVDGTFVVQKPVGPDVTICEATSSQEEPYRSITVEEPAVDGTGGAGDHYSSHPRDIIPAIPGVHDGRNWDAEGIAIYKAGCEAVEPLDTDRDGLLDIDDLDDDGDGLLDADDADDDGDGVPDSIDPDAPNVSDRDGDRIPDADDLDDDGDGIADAVDPDSANVTDTDADRIPDGIDTDDDNDCIADVSDADRDGDGVADAVDTDADNDGLPDAVDSDDDGDLIPDYADADADGDSTPDAVESPAAEQRESAAGAARSGLTPRAGTCAPADLAEAADLDGDDVPDNRDRDDDGDGIEDARDPDRDGDGQPNVTDADDDGDGTPDVLDQPALVAQALKTDTDADGRPDVRDRDIDNDGVPNARDGDADGDGRPEVRDQAVTSPALPTRLEDRDGIVLLRPVRTSIGQQAVVSVRCLPVGPAPRMRAAGTPMGDVAARSRCSTATKDGVTRLDVRAVGAVTVELTASAPAVGDYRAFTQTRTYRIG